MCFVVLVCFDFFLWFLFVLEREEEHEVVERWGGSRSWEGKEYDILYEQLSPP